MPARTPLHNEPTSPGAGLWIRTAGLHSWHGDCILQTFERSSRRRTLFAARVARSAPPLPALLQAPELFVESSAVVIGTVHRLDRGGIYIPQ